LKFIADTGFVLARWSKSPARRKWAQAYFDKYSPPFLTADAVLIEAGYRLGVPELAPRLLRDGDYASGINLEEHAEPLIWLCRKYADAEMDLADACVVLLSELLPGATVLTLDKRDFSLYRKRNGSRIKCDFGPD
jgi:predicted nucleic acid-binding protein